MSEVMPFVTTVVVFVFVVLVFRRYFAHRTPYLLLWGTGLVLYGIGTMIFIIIVLDGLIWRPIVAWSQKFRFDTVQAEEEKESAVLDFIRKSVLVDELEKL